MTTEFFSIFKTDLTSYLFPFLLVNELIFIISLPITRKIFQNFGKWYLVFSSLIGWFSIGFCFFLVSTVLAPFNVMNVYTLWVIVAGWFGINLFLTEKNSRPIRDILSYKNLLYKTAFLFFYLILYFIVARRPEIYQIERFMDFGFLKTLLNSVSLPLEDVWLAGKDTNYYYFGHFIAYVMTLLSRLQPEQTFFLSVFWAFATAATISFSLTLLVSRNVLLSLSKASLRFRDKLMLIVSGVISVFFFLFSGPYYVRKWIPQVLEYLLKLGPLNIDWFFTDFLQQNILKGETEFFWYAEPTRLIKGTITEFPFFSFLEAPNHAHMWGYLMAVVVVSLLAELFFSKQVFRWNNIRLYFLAFFLGISFITNSWDILTLGLLSCFVLLVKFSDEFNLINWKSFLVALVLNLLLLIVVILPWYLYFDPPVNGLGFVKEHSEKQAWLDFWGIYAGFTGAFILGVLYGMWSKRITQQNQMPVAFIWTVVVTSALFLIFAELFYLKDILDVNEWYRANTYFKITAQVWTWLSIMTGPIIVFLLYTFRYIPIRIIVVFLVVYGIFVGIVYPMETIKYFDKSRNFTGITQPVGWLNVISPSDHDAYVFLNKYLANLPQGDKKKTLVEGSGDSYKDNNFYSILLGWPSVVGWPVHEWTWRGSYDEIGLRRGEVGEIYQNSDIVRTMELLRKYDVDFIVVGAAEKRIYTDFLQIEKLRGIGEVIYDDGSTFVVKVAPVQTE